MKKITQIFFAITCVLVLDLMIVNAGEEKGLPYAGSTEFERMKSLVGVWEGTSNMGKEGQTARVEYQLTGGGSAIVETLFPGTPEEMVSVFHDDAGKLVMTHYCMLKNQPRMKLENSGEKTLDFIFTEGSDINPLKDPHMHALGIMFLDKDQIIEKWTMHENGREKHVSTLKLSRVQ
jgi:hypothetical protein